MKLSCILIACVISCVLAIIISVNDHTEKSSKPITSFSEYTINVGEHGTNALATLILMDDGTVRWK